MNRYFAELSYKGTNYHGWQIQPNADTVQETLEHAFSTLLQEKIAVVGAGRTDTGVHAQFYVAHFDITIEIKDTQNLIFKLNSFLPSDIAIYKLYRVDEKMHARFSALRRSYEYRIARRKLPFAQDYSHYIYGDLDTESMRHAAEIILQYEDFTSFSKLHTDTKNNLCQIFSLTVEEIDNILIIQITANRFLRNMVRAIAGTLIDVGMGKFPASELKSIIEGKNRALSGASAPAKGLFLTNIEYPGSD
ncbi:MAG: tRNA pseudouridine(38-40) synthase TruA [Bacteroidota bacterium]|nr:tRNA pseudouridine(38-40) synthase TruA [Bacteroidota bacterium]